MENKKLKTKIISILREDLSSTEELLDALYYAKLDPFPTFNFIEHSDETFQQKMDLALNARYDASEIAEIYNDFADYWAEETRQECKRTLRFGITVGYLMSEIVKEEEKAEVLSN